MILEMDAASFAYWYRELCPICLEGGVISSVVARAECVMQGLTRRWDQTCCWGRVVVAH